MSAVGYATIPVTLSFANAAKAVQSQLKPQLDKLSKDAAKGIEKNVSSAAEQAGKKVERARQREAKATEAATAAEAKYKAETQKREGALKRVASATLDLEMAQRKSADAVAKAQAEYDKLVSSGTASAEQLAVAERKISDARDRGKADVLKRETQLDNARSALTKQTQRVADAETELTSAKNKAAEASERVISATKQLDDAQSQAAKSTQGMTGMYDKMRESAGAAAQKAVAVAEKYKVHASVALGALGAIGKGAMDYAAEAEQSYGAVESIFKSHADTINSASKGAADAVGMSGRAYREQASYIGAMLKNQGVASEDLAGRSQELIRLGSDLAATYGGDVASAVEAIGATLRGETDPIERYGVSIKQADVNAKMAAMGLDGLSGDAEKAARSQALLALLTEQTADAQGQFARETDTAAHKQQVTNARIDDAREAIGTALLPVMADLMDVGAGVAEVIGEHPRLFLAIAGAVGTLAAGVVALGAIAPIFTAVSAAAAAAGTSMWGYVAAQAAAVAPIAAVVAGVGVLAAGLTYFFTQTERGQQIWQDFTDKIKLGIEAVQVAWEELAAAFQGGDWGFGQLAEWFGEDWAQSIVNGVATVGEVFREMQDFARGVVDILFRGDYTGLPFGLEEDSVAVGVLFSIRDAVFATWDALKGMAGDVSGSVLSVLGSLWEVVKAVGGALWDVAQAVAPVLIPVLKVVAGLVGGVLFVAFRALMGAIRVTAGVIGGLAQAFAWVVENAIVPFISAIAGVVSWVAEKLPGAISAAADWLQSAFHAIGGFFQSLGSAMKSVWDGVILPVFNAFVTAGQWLVTIISTVVLTPLVLAWEALSWAFKQAYDSIIMPTVDAFAGAMTWLYDNAVRPVMDWIVGKWNELASAFETGWAVVNAIFDYFAGKAQEVWGEYLSPVFQAISDGWNVMVWAVQLGWAVIRDEVFEPFAERITGLWESYVSPVLGYISDKWSWLKDSMLVVKGIIVDLVFGKIEEGLSRLKSSFQVAVDGIRFIWDQVKAITAKPARFVVETVYNNGIRKAWGLVSKFTGLDPLPEADLGYLGSYASGGVLPGYSPGRDDYRFVDPVRGTRINLGGGEAIMRPEWARMVGKKSIDRMNAAAARGRLKPEDVAAFAAPVPATYGGLSGVSSIPNPEAHERVNRGVLKRAVRADMAARGFASGGIYTPTPRENQQLGSGVVNRTLWIAAKTAFPGATLNSAMTDHFNDGGYHPRGQAVDLGGPMQQIADWIFSKWPKSAQLIWGPGPLALWGRTGHIDPSDQAGIRAAYGPGTMAGHYDHVHWASDGGIDSDGIMVSADGASAAGGGFDLGGMVKSMWDRVIDQLPKWDGPGMIGKLPGAMLSKLATSAWDFVKDKVGHVFGGAPGHAGNAESWREMAMAAMRREGFNADDPAQVDAMLAQIQSESGGDPNIAQQIVDINGSGEAAGVGLLQIIPGTFAAHRDPSLPNDRRNPEANMVAALRYYRARYGTDLTSVWGHGHGYAAGGVLPGYTPGRDVHQFFSPTAGWLGLSGGESIMVPEWTRSVGGPAAVEQMNRAARGGRAAAGTGAGFAAGGVFAANAGDPVTRLAGAADMLAVAVAEIREGYHGGAMGYGALASVLRNEPWARAIVNGAASLGRISDPDTLEGIAARAFANESVDILGSLGAKNTAAVAGSLITAESNLVKARKDSASRVAAIAAAEETLAEKRRELAALQGEQVELSVKDQRKLADAEKALAEAQSAAGQSAGGSASAARKVADAEEALEKARESGNADKIAKAEKRVQRAREDSSTSSEKANDKVAKAEEKLARVREDLGIKQEEDEEKRAEAIEKSKSDIVKAEDELLKARRASAAALDMKVYDVFPQLYDGLSESAVQAQLHLPQVAGALSNLAFLAGPAGASVGMAVQAAKNVIDVVQTVWGVVEKIADWINKIRTATRTAVWELTKSWSELTGVVDQHRGMVAQLQMQLVNAALDVISKSMEMRTAQVDVVRAQLQGAKNVAEAEGALQAERDKVTGKQKWNFRDMSLEYDRFRQGYRDGINEQIAGMTQLSAEERQRIMDTLSGVGSVSAEERDRILSAMDGVVSLTAEERARLSASVAGMSELSERERARVMVSLNGVGQLTEEERDRVRQAVGSFDDLTAGERERINSALAGVGTLTEEERARVANAIANMGDLSAEERARIVRAINGVSEVAQEERLRVVAALTGIGSIHGKEEDLTRQIVANADREGLAAKLGLDAKLAAQKAADDAYVASVNGREVGEKELHQMYKLQLAEQLVGEQAFQNLKDASLDAQLEWQRRVDKAAQLGLEHELKARAVVTPEILALQREVYAAEFAQQKSILDAQIKGIEATFAQQQALVSMGRLQEDLIRQQAELDRLSGDTMGMNQGQAIVMEEIARLQKENAEILGKRNSAGAGARNFFGRLFDWDGDGNNGTNTWSVERKQYDAQIAANNAQIEELQKSVYAQGAFTPAQQREIDKATKLAAKYFAQGNEAAAKAALQASPLGNAQRSLEVNKTLSRITDWESKQRDLARSQQDALAEFKKNTRIMPLQWRSQELESRESAQRYAADALRSENDGVRDALATLSRLEESNAAELKQLREKPAVVNLTVSGPRDGVTTIGQMEDALVTLAGELGATRTTVKRLDAASRTSASDRVRAAIGKF